ncbi:MAG: hypothetical protein WKF73_04210 [Nocardioidaceae bacterium]
MSDPTGFEIRAPRDEPRQDEILAPAASAFVADLQRTFGGRRDELLAARVERRKQISETGTLDFLGETREVREGQWRVAPAPVALQDRRVEITGPTDPKMAINALNSGARVARRPRGCQHAALVERHRRAGFALRRAPPPARLHL